MKTSLVLASVAGVLSLAAVGLRPVAAAPVTITSGNSSIVVNPVKVTAFHDFFITSWKVDGVDEFGGSTLGDQSLEFGFNSGTSAELNFLTLENSSVNGGTFTATYDLPNTVSVAVKQVLTGGAPGSGNSMFDQTFTITNLGTQSQEYDFGTSLNFNLGGVSGNNTLNLEPSSSPFSAAQTDPAGTKLKFTFSPTPTVFLGLANGTAGQGDGPFVGEPSLQIGGTTTLDPGASSTFEIDETITGEIPSSGTGGGPGVSVPVPSSATMVLSTLVGIGMVAIGRRKKYRADSLSGVTDGQ